MKKNFLKVTAALLVALSIGFVSCDDDEDTKDAQKPTVVSMTIGSDNTSATVYFSEGVYKNSNATGELDNESLTVEVTAGSVDLTSYTVTHTAGANSAEIALTLSGTDSDGSENLNLTVTATSAFDADGNEMTAGNVNVSFNEYTAPIDPKAVALTAYEVEGKEGLPEGWEATILTHFNDNNNSIGTLSIDEDNIVPSSGSATAGVAPSDSWFDAVTYQGAFQPGGSNWADGWTLTYGQTGTSTATEENVVSANVTKDTTWTSDKIWVLDGFIFVEEGATLTIEPGTMVQGKAGQEENASALIVKMGGKIMAEGTAAAPIVFTGYGDTYEGDGYGKEVRGLWGGLIVLGKATTNNSTQKRIEGIPESYNAFYGGTDDTDNSGVYKYISIRHGGTDIGAGNEINGFTLGGVGSGTTIDHVEVVANVDDGIEFFGGCPNMKYVLVSYGGDDSFDYDEGFHGKGQFWATVHSDGAGDRCGEHDGGTGDDEEATPYAKPMIYNVTYIGNGDHTLITFRDNAGGTYANSIFVNTSKGIQVEYRNDKDNSWDRMLAGDLVIKNNIFIETGF